MFNEKRHAQAGILMPVKQTKRCAILAQQAWTQYRSEHLDVLLKRPDVRAWRHRDRPWTVAEIEPCTAHQNTQ